MAEITVENITPDEYDDSFVVDCARVSFAKRSSQFTYEQNAKLIRYLHNPPDSVPHWAPFAGPRLKFYLDVLPGDLIVFLLRANQTGFTVTGGDALRCPGVWVDGSLWAWYENLWAFPEELRPTIVKYLREWFPICAEVFKWNGLDDDEPLDPRVVPQRSDYANLRIKAPIFVARQLVKHQKELVWSEVSRRYISSEPELWWPKKWHKAPTHSKQGASDEEFNLTDMIDPELIELFGPANGVTYWKMSADMAVKHYNQAVKKGMAPEEARMILPQNMMTEWIWTGSLRAFVRVIRERTAPGAQQSGTRETAEKIAQALNIRM